MHNRNGQIALSPTDLGNFLGCPHAIVLDFRRLSGLPLQRTFSEADQLLAKKGQEHEAGYLQTLRDAGKTVAAIPRGVPFQESMRQTDDALRAGVEVNYQAALSDGPWSGFADFLVKTDRPSALGPFSYEVFDTKLAHRPEPKHVIQIGVYSDLLGARKGCRRIKCISS